MKKVKFLTRAYGEYNYTPRTIEAPYIGQGYNKEELHPTILSSSDWRPTSKLKYSVDEIEIPEWMEASEFSEHNWKWYKAIGGNEDLGKVAYDKITAIQNGTIRLALVKLLKQKSFRSDFRKSLRLQLEKWLYGDSEYQYPFSDKQFSFIINDYLRVEAKQIGVA